MDSAGELTAHLQGMNRLPAGEGELSASLLDGAARALLRSFDPVHGGFGEAPKFPHPMDLRVLLRHHARTGDPQSLHAARHTLDKMARGGIYDHLGGGFARYSTDDRWLVPHFEKMLYDNALLSTTYLEAYQLTRDASYAQIARETLDYTLGRMTSPEGGFYSTEDADSEGVEGKYYVWSLGEILETLGPESGKTFASVYDVTGRGNWEESNILNLPRTLAQAATTLGRDERELREELGRSRAKLLEVRDRRVPPGKDTKVLTSWNGLMLAPMAEGARVLGDERYLDAARGAAAFLLDKVLTPDGRLLHSYKDGQARFNGYLDDYATLIDGLTRLYEASGEPRWIEAATRLAERMTDDFLDIDGMNFYYTGDGHESLIARTKELYDNATPSANAMAATALLRLGWLTGREDFLHRRPAGDRVGPGRHGAGALGRGPEPDRPGFPARPEEGVRRRRPPRGWRVPRRAGDAGRAVPAAQGRGAGPRRRGRGVAGGRPPARGSARQGRPGDGLHLRADDLPGAGRRRGGADGGGGSGSLVGSTGRFLLRSGPLFPPCGADRPSHFSGGPSLSLPLKGEGDRKAPTRSK